MGRLDLLAKWDDCDKYSKEDYQDEKNGKPEMNLFSKIIYLSKGYKWIRIEYSSRWPHFHLLPNKWDEWYVWFKTIQEFKKALPNALKKNPNLIKHAEKVLKESKNL